MNIMSNSVNNRFKDYEIIKDKIGMSPAEVYKLANTNEVLFLKRINNKYYDTTYDVKREITIIRWLSQRIKTPKIIYYEEDDAYHTFIMTEAIGESLDEKISEYSLNQIIDIYVLAIETLQTVSIDNCPFDNSINNRLAELEYLIKNSLADVDSNNWEADTEFEYPQDLLNYLITNKPNEDFVFSHGDLCNSNIFIKNGQINFIDLGRSGIADKWLDIAFCVREIKELNNDKKYIDLFFNKLGLTPDWEKIRYYILLDEMF